ncbi:MAG: peptidoglycan DD-metalloendopeptidase family protein [Actinobacteria bacterium]|uniref:Unannotated protein n=1 Tax=freshwater metagenome TaxID=449393 RepID=A0A6J6F1H6_9ZZZZ|nr:peptidoglycan DD-metalloendopeptidase family protein [Actinomycetota bacterium]
MKALFLIGLFSWLAGLGVIPNPPAGSGVVLRPYSPPASEFARGHRGVDLDAMPEEFVITPISGVVHFAGYVVDRPVLTIATATILMTFEPVDSFLIKGQRVTRGEIVGWVGLGGHCNQSCIHVGVRRVGTRIYLDPIPYLLGIPRLLPATL